MTTDPASAKDGYERVRDAFSRLDTGKAHVNHVLRVNVGSGEAYQEAIVAKDDVGQLHLMVTLPAGRKQFDLPVSEVLVCRWREVEGFVRLDVECADARLRPTFTSLIGEMLDRAESSGRAAIDELQEVLGSWRRALMQARAEVGRETVAGLFGELLVAREIALQDPQAVGALWKGPAGGVHDFADVHAVEVKTYRTTGTPVVTIHGLDQLDPPEHGDLHLVAYRVWDHPTGTTVDQLADELQGLGVSGVFLRGVFKRLGVPRNAEHPLPMLSSKARIHRVSADFPGLRRSQLADQQIQGLDRVQYGVALDACPGERSESDLGDILRGLRGAA